MNFLLLYRWSQKIKDHFRNQRLLLLCVLDDTVALASLVVCLLKTLVTKSSSLRQGVRFRESAVGICGDVFLEDLFTLWIGED